MRRGHTRITITLEMKSPHFYSPVEVAQTMLSRMFRDGKIGEWENGQVFTGRVPFVGFEDIGNGALTAKIQQFMPVCAFARWEKL